MIESQRWLWIAGVLLLGWLLYLLHPILSPFLIGVLLAYMGDPLVDRFERWKLSRTWGVVVVFALIGLVMAILLLVLVPMLVLSNWGRASYLPFDADVVEGLYQVGGFVVGHMLNMLLAGGLRQRRDAERRQVDDDLRQIGRGDRRLGAAQHGCGRCYSCPDRRHYHYQQSHNLTP